MAHYRTCTGCLFEGKPCGERDKLRAKVAGLGITALKWRCKWKRPKFNPGDPVFANIVTRYRNDDNGCETLDAEGFPGVFIQDARSPTKVIIFIAPGTESVHGETFYPSKDGNGFCRISRSYLTKREGVPDSVCEYCSNPVSLLGHADYCARKQ